jgi:hypothetical protein
MRLLEFFYPPCIRHANTAYANTACRGCLERAGDCFFFRAYFLVVRDFSCRIARGAIGHASLGVCSTWSRVMKIKEFLELLISSSRLLIPARAYMLALFTLFPNDLSDLKHTKLLLRELAVAITSTCKPYHPFRASLL